MYDVMKMKSFEDDIETEWKPCEVIDHNVAEMKGFVIYRITFWIEIRLLHRIRAPILTSNPTVVEARLTWNKPLHQVPSASSSWIKLGMALRRYQMSKARSKSLMVEDDEAIACELSIALAGWRPWTFRQAKR